MVSVPWAPEPLACWPRSGMRSRFWWASFSNRTKSCISTGPRGPAVMLFWLSETGMPLSVVRVGRLAMKSFLFTSNRDPGNALRRRHCFATRLFQHQLLTDLRLRKARGVGRNVCVRFAMTLVLLLCLWRLCLDLGKPEVIQLPLPRSPCGHHWTGVRRAAVRRRTRTGRLAGGERDARQRDEQGQDGSGRQRRTHRGLFLIPDATPPQLMALHRRAADDLDA